MKPSGDRLSPPGDEAAVLMSLLDFASNPPGKSSLLLWGGGGHEVSHAAQHDRVGLSAFQALLVAPPSNSESNGVMQIRVGASSEEARATGVETRAALELGEPARKSYSDTNGTVNVCSPTSNREC